jgi:hypothetical protein
VLANRTALHRIQCFRRWCSRWQKVQLREVQLRRDHAGRPVGRYISLASIGLALDSESCCRPGAPAHASCASCVADMRPLTALAASPQPVRKYNSDGCFSRVSCHRRSPHPESTCTPLVLLSVTSQPARLSRRPVHAACSSPTSLDCPACRLSSGANHRGVRSSPEAWTRR